MKVNIMLSILMVMAISACKKNATAYNPQDYLLQLNQIQVIASHNSYHKRDIDTIFNFLEGIKSALPADDNPDELDYSHEPFDIQMSQYGVRGLELDIWNDPNGGAFYLRKINEFAGLTDTSYVPELLLPGLKMLHIKDVDYNSTYNTFKGGLQAIKSWSDQHPNHLPLFINIETIETGPSQNATLASLGFKDPIPFDATACDEIDNEIKSVFGTNLDAVLTPDKIRNGLSTLNDVVVQHKWPKLGQCRGKVIFIMEGPALNFYAVNHPSLKGRTVFTYAQQGTPEAAFLLMNDAVSQEDSIKARVKDGYIVRSRSDAGTIEARAGDYSSMNASFASGAQITSTDYYHADPRGGIPGSGFTTFEVKFPNGELARKNPINADTVKVDEALKE